VRERERDRWETRVHRETDTGKERRESREERGESQREREGGGERSGRGRRNVDKLHPHHAYPTLHQREREGERDAGGGSNQDKLDAHRAYAHACHRGVPVSFGQLCIRLGPPIRTVLGSAKACFSSRVCSRQQRFS
jgi:hypothetical protein